MVSLSKTLSQTPSVVEGSEVEGSNHRYPSLDFARDGEPAEPLFLTSRGYLYQTACPCTLQNPKTKRLCGNGLQGQKISFLERPENFSERGRKKGAALQESMGKNQYTKAPLGTFAVYLSKSEKREEKFRSFFRIS